MARRIHLPQAYAQWAYPRDDMTDFVILSALVSQEKMESEILPLGLPYILLLQIQFFSTQLRRGRTYYDSISELIS